MNIGIIGESLGNGHPYSWSAIINGFNYNLLNKLPFPAIKQYLADKDHNKVLDKNIRVTKIFCKNIDYAKKVAEFSKINEVCLSLENFSNNLHAIIIAKDDYKNHYDLIDTLSPLKLPILIDKPIATKLDDLIKILKLKKYESQFFSCSGLYFSPEINDFPRSLNELNKIKVVTNGPWDRYSIHMINPLEKYFGDNDIELSKFTSFKKSTFKNVVHLELEYNNLIVELVSGSDQIFGVNFTFYYRTGVSQSIKLTNTYKAFSDMLSCFLDQIKYDKLFFSEQYLKNTIKIVELGVNH